jgi:hypothetical protein
MLDEHTFTIDAEDIEVGLQHLRYIRVPIRPYQVLVRTEVPH